MSRIRSDRRMRHGIGGLILTVALAAPAAAQQPATADASRLVASEVSLSRRDAVLRVELSDGKRLAMDAHQITLRDEHGNGLTIQSDNGAVTIQAAGSISLRASQISIESSGSLAVTAAGTLTLRGSVVSIN